MEKMVNCKACGKEIAKGVKKCVHCGKDQRNFFMKHKVLTVVLALVILGVIGSAGGKKNSTTTTTTNSSSSQTAKKEEPVSKVGDVIKTDKFEITITSIEEKAKVGNQYISKSPSDGGTYIAVQWQCKNVSDKPIGSFSLPTIHLVDSNGTKYDADIDASGTFATEVKLDSKVLSDLNPGITVKNAGVFEISKETYQKGGWKLLINADKDVNVSVN